LGEQVAAMGTSRIKMVIQYDGTRYAGFQRQAGFLTIQEVLEDRLEELLGHTVKVRASGRTDAGVHARGQVIAFDTSSSIPAERMPRALNGLLPEDIIVNAAHLVSPGFNPMKDAVSKTYCYRIWRKKELLAFAHRYVLWYPGSLDLDLMVQETVEFLGANDFSNFRNQGSSAKTTVRNVSEARWIRRDIEDEKDVLWEFWVTADGFLYRMIRLMVGTLIDVGRGYLPPGTVREALDTGRKNEDVKIGRCVPGKGLCLERVQFS